MEAFSEHQHPPLESEMVGYVTEVYRDQSRKLSEGECES